MRSSSFLSPLCEHELLSLPRFNGGKFSFVRPFKFVGRGLPFLWRRLAPLSIPRPMIESRDSVRVVLGLAEQSPHPPGCKIRQFVA